MADHLLVHKPVFSSKICSKRKVVQLSEAVVVVVVVVVVVDVDVIVLVVVVVVVVVVDVVVNGAAVAGSGHPLIQDIRTL